MSGEGGEGGEGGGTGAPSSGPKVSALKKVADEQFHCHRGRREEEADESVVEYHVDVSCDHHERVKCG